MSSILNMRAFPVASELFSPLSIRPGSKSKPSLAIPRSTKSSATGALAEMLVILVCFALGLYIATQMYGFALGMIDAQLPRAFAVCFCAAYAFQLFVGWLEVRDERRWSEKMRERE
jgi:hypothetical protein